ncbi:MAG: hypothetical protein MI743_20665 [Sneathiellales bacterium]|nr:hypothetical protein [Sneathiellales bacterium]
MTIRSFLAAAAVSFSIALPNLAEAATIYFDFTTISKPGTGSAVTFEQDGVSVNVSAARFNDETTTLEDEGLIGFLGSNGAYVQSGYSDSGAFTGHADYNEVILFDFSEDVNVQYIHFARELGDAQFITFQDIYGNGNTQLAYSGLPVPGDGNPSGHPGYLLPAHDMFGIGSFYSPDASFSIAGLTVTTPALSTVPLPPAMLMFVPALAGLGWLSRKGRAKKGAV